MRQLGNRHVAPPCRAVADTPGRPEETRRRAASDVVETLGHAVTDSGIDGVVYATGE